MSTEKLAIRMDKDLLKHLDRLMKNRIHANRSRASQEAVREKIERLERGRLARECAKLDRAFEQVMAEEGMYVEAEKRPEY